MKSRFLNILIFILICCSISFIGTTIWLLIERSGDTNLEYVHQSVNGVFRVDGRNGKLEMRNSRLEHPVEANLGKHLDESAFKAAKLCNFGDYCVDYETSRLMIKTEEHKSVNNDPVTCYEVE